MMGVSLHQKVGGFWHTHTRKKSDQTGPVSEVWRWVPEGAGEGGRGLSELQGKLRNGAESQVSNRTASKFHRLSFPAGQWAAGLTPRVVQSLSLAGREKTSLVSLTLADEITTVLTSCSHSKVLSSCTGDVRSDLWWLGFFFSWCALCKKSERFFLVFHCGIASLVVTRQFQELFKISAN